MKYVLLGIDPQNCFVDPKGELTVYNPKVTPRITKNIRDMVDFCMKNKIPMILSSDSHSYDSWEFKSNGGPFPPHAVKGTWGWLFIDGMLPEKFRYIPMCNPGSVEIGENVQSGGNRVYLDITEEALNGVAIIFEKEVYSLFSNPNAVMMLRYLVRNMGGRDQVTFIVTGFCTGGFCVDAAVEGLVKEKFNVIVLNDATQAIDGVHAKDGASYSMENFEKMGVEVLTTTEMLEML